MNDAALQLEGVVKRYRRRRALDGLDLSVGRGAIFGLVGSNGAGKTTALSVTAGLVRICAGKVNVLGRGPFDPARDAGRLSLMPQDALLPPYARVRDILGFYARLQGADSRSARGNVAEVLDWVNLSDRADATIRSLSHGLRRRVVIAQAFLGSPELVLLDEPLSGLDPREVVNIRGLLLQRRGRQTIVMSSHDLHELERTCDQVAFIENGKLVRQGAMDEVVGRKHSLVYAVESADVPFVALQKALPSVAFRKTAAVDCAFAFECEYGGELSAAAVNAAVLRCLLDAGVGVVEIRRGSELESIYLGMSGTPAPRPR